MLEEPPLIVSIRYLPGRRLGDVQGKPKNVRVGLAEVDEAGGDKGIHEPAQLELVNPVIVHYARFVADNDYLQPIADLQLPD